MRHHNQTSQQTLPRTSSGHRSRSQNHYYIQANEFEKRYKNSLINAYRLNSSRKCPPCCNVSEEMMYGGTFGEYEKENFGSQMRNGQYERHSEYYPNSYFRNQNEQEALTNLQKSKRFLEELVQKSSINFRVYKEKTQQQIQTLEKLLQSKNTSIEELTKQITLLKKISLEISPSTGQNISYIKQDPNTLAQIQAKQKTIKELERKCSRYREQNSYFRQDIEIKNKEIQHLKQKFRMKEGNDMEVKKDLERENNQLREEKRTLVEKVGWFERVMAERENRIKEMERIQEKDQENMKKAQAELDILRVKLAESKTQSSLIQHRYTQQLHSIQSHLIVIKQKSNQKNTQIQHLNSRITSIQSELDFFKEKFTNLLFEIEREERQSQVMFEHATSLKEEGMKIFEATERMRLSELLESQAKTSRTIGLNPFQQVENREMIESVRLGNTKRVGFAKETVFQSLSPRNYTKQYGLMGESNIDLIYKFPSLMNMSISPIRTKD